MEKIIIKEPVKKVITNGYEDVIKFKTIDGKIFDKENEAEKHEKKYLFYKKMSQIEKTDAYLPEINNQWLYASNEEELDTIEEVVGLKQTYDYVEVHGEVKVGEWITYTYYDGGDYRGTYEIYTLSYVKNEISKFLSKFE